MMFYRAGVGSCENPISEKKETTPFKRFCYPKTKRKTERKGKNAKIGTTFHPSFRKERGGGVFIR